MTDSFSALHPVLTFCYFAAVLLLTMFVLHPVFLALSLLGALGYCALLRGWRSLWRTLGRLVPFLVLMLASTIGYAVTKRKMTWWEHHASTERISRYTIITGCLMMLTGIVMILQIFLGVTHAGAELLLAVGVMCTALAPFAMYFLEKKMRYTTQKNEVELPPGEPHLIG